MECNKMEITVVNPDALVIDRFGVWLSDASGFVGGKIFNGPICYRFKMVSDRDSLFASNQNAK